MGGGREYSEARKLKCFVMFPQESGHNTIQIDGIHLMYVGLSLLKRIGQKYLGNSIFGVIHERPDRTFVSVCSENSLKHEIESILKIPGESLLLCIIYVDESRDSIGVITSGRSTSLDSMEQSQNFLNSELLSKSRSDSVLSSKKEENTASLSLRNRDDYVVLQKPVEPDSMPTFFISSSWHLQADRMSATMSSSSNFDTASESTSEAVSEMYVVVKSEDKNERKFVL